MTLSIFTVFISTILLIGFQENIPKNAAIMSKNKIEIKAKISTIISENKNNDLTELNLKGNVKSVTTKVYFKRGANATTTEENFMMKGIQTFNEKGFLVSEKRMNKDGKFIIDMAFTYTSKKPSETVVTVLYNTNNRKELLTYNSKHTLLSAVSYDTSGNIEEKVENTLNEKGNIISDKEFRNDRLSRTNTYIYDASGELLSRKVFTSDGVHSLTMNYNYNGNEKTETTTMPDQEGSRITTFIINDKGDKTKHYANRGAPTLYEYTYDAQDNWIEKKQLKNDLASAIEVREIEYYK